MRELVKKLDKEGLIDVADIPQLHRMATAYDTYLTCLDEISEKGLTMTNNKGETVKRPEANLLRESWSQYLELAKEYGLTAKSKRHIKELSSSRDELSPLEEFLKKRIERRG